MRHFSSLNRQNDMRCSSSDDIERKMCKALDALRAVHAYLFSEPNHTRLSFMWQNDMHAIVCFIIALRISVLREAEPPPYQPDVVGSVCNYYSSSVQLLSA